MNRTDRIQNLFRNLVALALIGALGLAANTARALDGDSIGRDSHAADTTEPSLHVDVEVDPLAYILSGYSLHAGLTYGRLRIDLGAFALAMPQFVHGDDGFDLSFNGYGAKAQLFVLEEQRGLFVGVDTGVAQVLAERQGSQLSERHTQVTVGVNVGYRIALPARFYVTPWIGVGYAFGTRDVTLAGATTKGNPLIVFPTVHVGYRFQ